MPALDGLRAMAVFAVLFFHAQSSFAPGGFLGVSVFFTLSGYLITSLLLNEHARTNSISLRAFYARRLRRLMPASFACIAIVIALGGIWTAYQRKHLPGDVVAALANVSNWRFAFASRSYSDLFLASPSPLAHYWSLAIEEQCYVILPIVVLLALRRGRRTLLAVTTALLLASLAATLLTTNFDVMYNGTHTRAAELLIGVLLAQLLDHRRIVSPTLNWVGVAALVALAALVATSDVRDRWLSRGGLVAVAVLSATVIAALSSGGMLARALSWRPLVAIGRISYGLYLVHWPLFLVLSPARTHLHGVTLTSVRIALSIAIAALSYHQLELPIRQRHVLGTQRMAFSAMSITLPCLLLAALFALPHVRYTPTQRLLSTGASGLIDFAHVSEQRSTDSTSTTPTARRRRILVLGSDNFPVSVLSALGDEVVDGVQTGCPIARAQEIRFDDGAVLNTSDCEAIVDRWPRLIEQSHPDAVIISIGSLDRAVIRRETDQGFPGPADIAEFAVREESAFADLNIGIALIEHEGVPYLVADHPSGAAASADLEIRYLNRLRLTHPTIQSVITTDTQLASATAQVLDQPNQAPTDGRLRVLVIGDSTSLDMAQALSDAAPDRLHVTWGGENGCPFVRAESVRLSHRDQWRPNACAAFDKKVPPLLDSFHPDVVLLVASLLEVAEQRYPGDSASHVAGDAAYNAFHDSEMTTFVAILKARGVPLLVADSPGFTAGLATSEQARPQRTSEWNAQIRRWDDASPYIAVFDYTGPLAAAEAAHGSIRPDGVHPEIGPLTELARQVLVDELVARTHALRQSLGL